MIKYCFKKRDGSLFGPVNLPAKFAGLTQQELAALEPTPWYPHNKVIPSHDPTIERLIYNERVLINGVATDPVTVADLTAEEITTRAVDIADRAWLAEMQAHDAAGITRDIENIIDSMDANQIARLDQVTKDKHAAKKTSRGNKPS